VPAFAVVVVVLMSVVGLWRVYGPRRLSYLRPERAIVSWLLIPVGSAALVVPSMLVHFQLGQRASAGVLAALLGSGVCWFVGECSRLRLLEEVANSLPGRDLGIRARNVRWGSYAVLLLVATGTGLAMFESGHVRFAAPQISGAFIVMTSVSLMLLTLLSSLLCGRIAQVASEHAAYVRVFSAGPGDFPTRRARELPLPDEPDWIIN
jgi:hypothetical protein